MRALYRIRVDGATAMADRLREYLDQAGYRLVADQSWAVCVVLSAVDGEHVVLDSVASALESRIEANLEDLDSRFPGLGHFRKQRAGGNRHPRVVAVACPTDMGEGAALAVFRAIVQVTEQPEEPVAIAAPVPVPPARPRWRLWFW